MASLDQNLSLPRAAFGLGNKLIMIWTQLRCPEKVWGPKRRAKILKKIMWRLTNILGILIVYPVDIV